MKFLFVGSEWDYGDPSRGPSFEQTNLWNALERIEGLETRQFDAVARSRTGGPDGVRRGLLEAIDEFDPDVVFVVLFEHELPRDLLAELRDRPRPFMFNWFCDDHWRFDDFTVEYAPLFNGVSTTATSALPKYASAGISHVVKTQWGCNHHLYRSSKKPLRHDVTFVGLPHGSRRRTVRRLRRAGVPLEVWGYGWPNGRLTQSDMIDTFATSRINLNLTNSSVSRARALLGMRPTVEQIKGRNFEIPGCGGFQLSGRADDIERYFDPDVEIVLFTGDDDLRDRLERYLTDDARRASIALAGWRRTLSEHTYEHRYRTIFADFDVEIPGRQGH